MDVSSAAAATEALHALIDPFRLLMLGCGVLMGLFLGIVPGIGGLAGMALLLPFTFNMDPFAAFALLLGMSAVIGTSDTIPAVMFGVPGTAGAQATILDGNPMARKGEAGRALSAAFTASLIGGLVGALLLALTIPILRPFILYIASPELLAFSIFGISMVAVLSGTAPLRGLVAAGVGILLSMIGSDPQTGTMRWTLGQLYLWDGLPIVPLVLGLFALPELADLAINRRAISETAKYDTRSGMRQGVRDVFANWWLVVRCGGIGAAIGAIPGMGSAVVDWIAYGHAAQTVKGAKETFGHGDVRGVIAPESANNSLTAGSLVPTVAFGVPGSAAMAILLGVFLIHGLEPGPKMLSENLAVTYTMVWSVAIANILGAGLCFAFSGQLAKIALLRYTVILPPVLTFVFIGAYQASRSWGDLYTLLIFAVIGWLMKQFQWPRPPLILGFVLGSLIELYMFISVNRFGFEWLTRPLVAVLLLASLLMILLPALRWVRTRRAPGVRPKRQPASLRRSDMMYGLLLGLAAWMVWQAWSWPFGARIGPLSVGIFVLVIGAISFAAAMASRVRPAAGDVSAGHMDTPLAANGLSGRKTASRAAMFGIYLLGFLGSIAVIGMIPTVAMFTIVYMRVEARESWRKIAIEAACLVLSVWIVFDRLLHIPWPSSVLGQAVPVLQVIPSV
ncbi:MAG: tripartite tricarboxylate transporter permease [Celeribacter sp.]|jgi:TctA family transporter